MQKFWRFYDFIWPRRCEICMGSVDHPARHICSRCLETLEFAEPGGCEICARTLPDGVKGGICSDCAERRPYFEKAAGALAFLGNARRIVIDYKFNSHIWMRDDFTDFLQAACEFRLPEDEIDLVIPMPLTIPHRFTRGFNQCEYLAKPLARRIGKECATRAVRRKGMPRRQSGLRGCERIANVAGTFEVTAPETVANRTILLLDDIMTTGATLSECSKTLREAGASRVFALALARVI